MNDSERLREIRPALETRSRVFHAVRQFFLENDYLEVTTPVRLPTPALELHIDAPASGDHFLRTSPELHMKRLIAAGYQRIFQIGPCFRQGEVGKLHQPEFTMLEWYRANTNYRDILSETQQLINTLCENLGIPCLPEWEVLSIREAFLKYADWDPITDFDADRFDLDLVERVEPALSKAWPVVLIDYPAPLAALAKKSRDVAERWELYINGIEIANAYSELNDAKEQRARFKECAHERESLGKTVYPLDEAFLSALENMPDAGGIAVGMDRLTMALTGIGNIEAITAFPTPDLKP